MKKLTTICKYAKKVMNDARRTFADDSKINIDIMRAE